jgi:dTDP-4-amino-4,6-dideoxygalactose transaminase
LGIKNIVLVSSGRLALYLILKTLLKEGDKLIVPAFTCNVILGAIKAAKVKPVFTDVDIETFNMEVKHIKQVFDSDVKAILMTHQFGLPCDIDEIVEFARKNGVLVIEDAAPALGATYKGKLVGSFGDVAFFSFQNSKVISTYEGGAIVTGDEFLFEKIKRTLTNVETVRNDFLILKAIMNKIITNRFVYVFVFKIWHFFSSGKYSLAEKLRLERKLYEKHRQFTPFQATLGISQLTKIKNILKTRNETARLYSNHLMNVDALQLPLSLKDRTHTYSRYAILLENSDKYKFHDAMRKKGVDLGFTFSYICPQYFEKSFDNYQNSLSISKRVLNLPITLNIDLNRRVALQIKRELSKSHFISETMGR